MSKRERKREIKINYLLKNKIIKNLIWGLSDCDLELPCRLNFKILKNEINFSFLYYLHLKQSLFIFQNCLKRENKRKKNTFKQQIKKQLCMCVC